MTEDEQKQFDLLKLERDEFWDEIQRLRTLLGYDSESNVCCKIKHKKDGETTGRIQQKKTRKSNKTSCGNSWKNNAVFY